MKLPVHVTSFVVAVTAVLALDVAAVAASGGETVQKQTVSPPSVAFESGLFVQAPATTAWAEQETSRPLREISPGTASGQIAERDTETPTVPRPPPPNNNLSKEAAGTACRGLIVSPYQCVRG